MNKSNIGPPGLLRWLAWATWLYFRYQFRKDWQAILRRVQG